MKTLKEKIESFMNSSAIEIPIDFTKGWNSIQEILLPLGYEELEFDGSSDDTNGWDVSFLYTWKHTTLPNIMVSGSLHTGDFKLNKTEEE